MLLSHGLSAGELVWSHWSVSCLSVCPSVCLSQSCAFQKWLNRSSSGCNPVYRLQYAVNPGTRFFANPVNLLGFILGLLSFKIVLLLQITYVKTG